MVALETVVLVLLLVAVVAFVLTWLFVLTAAVAVARVVLGFVGRVAPGAPDPRPLHAVEDALADRERDGLVDAGVVTGVVPERRYVRLRDWGRSDRRVAGVRVTVTVPTREAPEIEQWFALPTGRGRGSRLERFCQQVDVPIGRLSDLLGAEIPVERGPDGRWRLVGVDRRRSSLVPRGVRAVLAEGVEDDGERVRTT